MDGEAYLLAALEAASSGDKALLSAITELASEGVGKPDVSGLGDPEGKAAVRVRQYERDFIRTRLSKSGKKKRGKKKPKPDNAP